MTENCKELWTAVLILAIEDALGKVHQIPQITQKVRIIESAQTWFKSKNENVGSFLWICIILDLDPSNIRKYLYPLFPEAY